MAQNATSVVVDELKTLIDAIDELSNRRVMVGIPASGDERQGEREGIGNAALGYIHENGAPEAGIPPRPFLVPGVRSVQREIERGMKRAGAAALEGSVIGMETELHRVGLMASAAVKRKITEGPFVPLAPSTIAGRVRRGRTGIKPLIDTGQLRNAVTYVIRKDGE